MYISFEEEFSSYRTSLEWGSLNGLEQENPLITVRRSDPRGWGLYLCLVAQLCLTFCNPMDCSLPGSSVHRQEYWSGLLFPPPRDLPNPGIEPRSPSLQAESLPCEPPGGWSRESENWEVLVLVRAKVVRRGGEEQASESADSYGAGQPGWEMSGYGDRRRARKLGSYRLLFPVRVC